MHKVFIKRDSAGKAQKVLFGSMDVSVRGIYVQANNVIAVDDPTTAGMFAQAFDEAFQDGVKAGPFRASSIAKGYMVASAADSADLPKFSLALSPHRDASISLSPMSQRIRGAASSVLFAVMEPNGTGPVLDTLRQIAAKPTVFFLRHGGNRHRSRGAEPERRDGPDDQLRRAHQERAAAVQQRNHRRPRHAHPRQIRRGRLQCRQPDGLYRLFQFGGWRRRE